VAEELKQLLTALEPAVAATKNTDGSDGVPAVDTDRDEVVESEQENNEQGETEEDETEQGEEPEEQGETEEDETEQGEEPEEQGAIVKGKVAKQHPGQDAATAAHQNAAISEQTEEGAVTQQDATTAAHQNAATSVHAEKGAVAQQDAVTPGECDR